MKITKKTTLDKLLDNKKAEKILQEYGLPCVSCPFAQYEMKQLELGDVCDRYGIDSKKLIAELNKKL
jgi:hybrid cluster-associated redox disulfide protein